MIEKKEWLLIGALIMIVSLSIAVNSQPITRGQAVDVISEALRVEHRHIAAVIVARGVAQDATGAFYRSLAMDIVDRGTQRAAAAARSILSAKDQSAILISDPAAIFDPRLVATFADSEIGDATARRRPLGTSLGR